MSNVDKSILKNSILAVAIFTSVSANAKLLLEPHLGFNVHGAGAKGTDAVTYNGSQYGARVGFQSLGFMGGLDYTHSTYTNTTKPISGTSESDDKKRDEFGVFAGYKFPILLRAWVGYNFLAKETQTALSASSGKRVGDYNKGHSTELGVGFTGLPFVSINLSYKMLSYNTGYDSASNKTQALNPKYEPKEIVLGISIPLNLP
jgi:hypothetical protein